MNYKDWFGVPQGSATKPVTPADKLNYGIGVGMGALGLVGTMAGNLAGNKQELSQLKAADVGATSKADLASQIAGYTPTQLGRESLWASGLSGLASGAGAGVAAGGVGAIVGGVLGAASGIIGSAGRNRQNKLTERRLYTDQMNKFNSANAMLTEQSLSNALTNYAAYGGQFNVPTTYNQGLIEINNGGSHEQNPYGGVPYGIGINGKTNFVEEGEVVQNDYVFSNRLFLTPALTKPLGLSPKFEGKSFAKTAKLISKEAEERPYDPISRLTKGVLLDRLGQAQDITRQLSLVDKIPAPVNDGNYFQYGSGVTRKSKEAQFVENALSSLGKGIKKLYINPLINAAEHVGNTYAGLFSGSPLASSTPAALNPILPAQYPVTLYSQAPTNTFNNTSAASLKSGTKKKAVASIPTAATPSRTPLGLPIPVVNHSIAPDKAFFDYRGKANQTLSAIPKPMGPNPSVQTNYSDLGLLAPALGNLATLMTYTGQPAETVNIPRISSATRLNEYAPYTPIDSNYLASQLKGQSAGMRRSILDLAGGNRGAATAGLIAADQNYLGALADSYLKASEYNRAQQMQNLQFTNQARQANAQMGLQEQIYNQHAGLQEQQMNSANRAARRAGILGGIQAIGNNIGEVSRYNKNLRTIRNAYLYTEEGKLIGI